MIFTGVKSFCPDSSIYTTVFFEKLRDEQGHQKIVLEKLSAGDQPPKKLMKYELLNVRRVTIAERYDPADELSTLRGIAKNLELNP